MDSVLALAQIADMKPFKSKVWLSSPTMHGDELRYVTDAIQKNWVSTVGENLTELERLACEYIGCGNAVALSSGTAALHLAVKLAGERLYGQPKPGHGTLEGRKVFCSDMTFDATVNPVAYEGGEAVFIDSEYETWNMDPVALERAFEIYPEVRLVVLANLYGTPAKLDEIRAVCRRHGALLVEDAAESLGATYKGVTQASETGSGTERKRTEKEGSVSRGAQTGTFGDYSVISFNGNKIITGSSGGMLLTYDKEAADKARKWSTQSREAAPWYQHEELGYNYRMSNIIAGIVRGQFPYLDEHIRQKKEIYMHYQDGFQDLPVKMNPYIEGVMEPNFWLSCLVIDKDAMCRQVRGEKEALYVQEKGKSCPTQILETLAKYNAEGRPIWKPMHLQPVYRMNPFITRNGNGRARSNAYIPSAFAEANGGSGALDVGADIFERGLCLPSDNKMTVKEQEKVIGIVRNCF